MANRTVLIESILGLAQKIGANPSKFMGTKGNINFLGTGDKAMKGTTFSGELNKDFLNLGFGKSDLIKVIEQDAGYVTAGKLNDMQLKTMFNNLKMVDETFNPPPGPMNVIDLETGTRNINKQGLESLRRGEKLKKFRTQSDEIQDIIDQKFGKGYFDDVAGDIERVEKQAAEQNFIKSGAADFTDSVAAEGGRRAVVRQVMKNNANYFGLTPEIAESIAKSKDLGKGGSQFADPLIVFRDKGNFTRQELEQIDAIIEANPFDDVKNIADKVSDYVQSIRPDGFAEGGRIGYKSGKSVKDKYSSDVVDSRLLDIGFDNMSLEEIKDLLKAASTYKTGGRVGYRSGKSVKGIAELLKLGKGQLKTADKIDRPAFAKQGEEFNAFNKRNYGGIENAEVPVEMMTEDLLLVKYPGISERLARLIGNDTNLQRKAEAIAAIEQGLALQGAGKSVDETIEILKREPKTKMKKGGLAQILEM